MIALHTRLPKFLTRVPSARVLVAGTLPLPVTGLVFPGNGANASDIRINFTGASYPGRQTKTVLWRAKFVQQAGYYAWAWDSHGEGAAWDFGVFSAGCHPFPCDGTIKTSPAEDYGLAAVPTADPGTDHYMEIAGNEGSLDRISTRADLGGTGAVFQLATGVWLDQAFTDELITVSTTNDTMQRVFYVDLSDMTKIIIGRRPVAGLGVPSVPTFSFGASPWRSGEPFAADQNDETPCGTFYNFKMFTNKLATSDIQAEAYSGLNSAVTVAGASGLHYSNVSPTPSDVADKSGAGHNPSWGTVHRPTLYTA